MGTVLGASVGTVLGASVGSEQKLNQTSKASNSISQPSWLSANQWLAVQSLEKALSKEEGLRGLSLSLSQPQHTESWQRFSSSPQPDQLPPQFLQELSEAIFTCSSTEQPTSTPSSSSSSSPTPPVSLASPRGSFLTLLLIKALCEDRLLGAIVRYITSHMGPKFSPGDDNETSPQSFSSLSQSSLSELYRDSNPSTPIVFILSSGADPSFALSKFGASMGRESGDRLHIISLGQGQGPIAESTLSSSIKNGDWVCLQNCHLAKSWMPRLEQMVEELQVKQVKRPRKRIMSSTSDDRPDFSTTLSPIQSSQPNDVRSGGSILMDDGYGIGREDDSCVHPDFRLWLTSMPAPHFPPMVLQSSIKVSECACYIASTPCILWPQSCHLTLPPPDLVHPSTT